MNLQKNVFGLGEVAFSVGLCVGKPFCQTSVISWLRLIKRELNLKREQKEFEKRSDGNKQNIQRKLP